MALSALVAILGPVIFGLAPFRPGGAPRGDLPGARADGRDVPVRACRCAAFVCGRDQVRTRLVYEGRLLKKRKRI